MRIGIITHWKDMDNYGAALQSYALQRYLRDLGHEAFVIRYYPESHRSTLLEKIFNLIKDPLLLFKIRRNKIIKSKLAIWNKQRDFNSFRSRNVVFSEIIYRGIDELRDNYPVADLYITGSDQVWHGSLYNEQNKAFFLDFGPNTTKRASYAASFGRNYFPCEDERYFKTILSKYEAISMREESGIEILKERGIQSIRCLDSTLLLTKEHYKALMTPRKHMEKYAFFYTVNVTETKEIYWEQIRDVFSHKGIKCIVTTGSGYKPADEIFQGAVYDYATVEEWLANVYYSEVVITASFHGIALSTILQKDFIYMPLQGKYKKGNDRITDLLESLGLTSRIATDWNQVIWLLEEKIDYSALDKGEFDTLLQQSKLYLKKLTE